MTRWLEIYYIGKHVLMPPTALDSSELSIGFMESSNDPLEPPSSEPITLDMLEEALDCLRQVQSIAGPNWREWLATAETVMRSVNVVNPENEE